jgi:hypothetical protein
MNSYFSHDSNARNDEKILLLRMKHNMEGYGVYFAILERMRDEKDYKCVKDYNMIAFDLRVDAALVKSVVENYGLFVFTDDGKYFYSESFLQRMKQKDKVSENRRNAANARWKGNAKQDDCKSDANAMQMHRETDASKVKESKVNNNSPPTPHSGGEGVPPSEKFVKFKKWLAENAPRVEQMKQPFTEKQYVEIFSKWKRDEVLTVLVEMHNYAPLLKKSISAYLTANTWLKRRKKDEKTNEEPKPYIHIID